MITEAAASETHHPVQNAPADKGLARGVRVLLAEDDRELRRLLAAELRKEGYRVDEAASGFELLELLGNLALRNESFDIIVSDIRMPGLTGMSIVEGLRKGITPGTATAPVILITAFGDENTHAAAARLGSVIFDKPFNLAAFRTCVVDMVNARPGVASPPAL